MNPRHVYAVTCWHVAVRGGASILRINTKEGKTRFIDLEPHEWQYDAAGDDLAAADVTDLIALTDDVAAIPDTWLASKDFINGAELNIGEDGFMLGLFADVPGENKNAVAGRFGNISLMADDEAPIAQETGKIRPAHIFDIRSRPGFSGSPVFVYRTPSGDLRRAHEGPRPNLQDGFRQLAGFRDMSDYWDARSNTLLKVLGVHVGQYRDAVEVRKMGRHIGEAAGDPIRDGDALGVPNGMTIVAPAWSVQELIDRPIFMERRRAREATDDRPNIDLETA